VNLDNLTPEEKTKLLLLLRIKREREQKVNDFMKRTDDRELYNYVYYDSEESGGKGIINDDESDYIVLKGSRNSGKSRAVVQELTRKLIKQKSKLLVVRKLYNSLEKSVYTEFKNVFDDFGINTSNFIKSITKSPLSMKFKNGSEIFYAGLDNEDSTKSIANIDYIFFEEIDAERDETVINTVVNSMRGSSSSGQKKQVYMAFNPPEASHWLKRRFYDNPDQNFKIKAFTTTYKDNRWCTDVDRKRLEALKDIDITQYRRDALGDWGVPNEQNGCVRPLDVERAFQNYEQDLVKPEGQYAIGVDVAGDGSDKAVLFMRKGMKIIDKAVLDTCTQPELLNRVITMVDDNYKEKHLSLTINFDATGIGTGVAEFCKDYYAGDKNITVNKVNNGERAKDPDQYKNCGAEMYINLRSIMKDISISRKLGEKLPIELCTRKYKHNDKRQYVLEPKEDFKKRNGFSPDEADAFALCFYEVEECIIKEFTQKLW